MEKASYLGGGAYGHPLQSVDLCLRSLDGLVHIPCIAVFSLCIDLSLVLRKPDFCLCENKDADQLRGNREADQRLCFRYFDSTIPLLPKYKISSL